VVFDDFEQNLTSGGAQFTSPAASEALATLAGAARAGKLLITCRYPLPGPDLFLAQIPLPALSASELRRLFLRLPALAALSPADRLLLMRTIGGHPRLIEFTDALLRGGRSNLTHVQTKLRDLATANGLDLRRPRATSAAAVQDAMTAGSADILLADLLDLLTPDQRTVLAQIAICRAPLTLADLAHALSPRSEPAAPQDQPDQADLAVDVDRLADLTLLTTSPQITMHPWTADLITRHISTDSADLHERALAMHMNRFEQGRGSYEDLLDLPHHQAALYQWDDIADIADQAARILPGTLATLAYLTEIRPLIPTAERAWMLTADLEARTLLNAGDLPGAIRQLQAIHQQVLTRAAADPASAEWQRDLSVSHSKLGDVAAAAGDLTAARTAYQAALDIRARLAAVDPANSTWQRDLSISYSKLGDVAVAAGDLTAARTSYQASLDIRARLAAADPANAGWQRDLSAIQQKVDGLGQAASESGTAFAP